MARYIGPKSRISRRFGEAIFGPDKVLSKKNYAPGQHGNNRRKKTSEYGLMLAEKQKAKYTYGVLERQFRNLFEKAAKKSGVTGEILLQLLESRLDNVVFRLGLAPTRAAARQLVSHGHIYVNDKRVKIASYQVKPGDVITVGEKAKQMPLVVLALESGERNTPDYINVDSANFVATFTRVPAFGDVPYPVQMSPELVVEFYSR